MLRRDLDECSCLKVCPLDLCGNLHKVHCKCVCEGASPCSLHSTGRNNHMGTTSPTTAEPTTQTDLPTAVQHILAASSEPLTVSKIRAQLPSALRNIAPEELGEFLRRQAAANVLIPYPKYRSQ